MNQGRVTCHEEGYTNLGVNPESIRAQLDRVLRSTRFSDAPRISAFLRFVVEKSLAGERDQIKEIVIGMEVYGRGGSFNPQVDSIVRVEASRLRSKLRDFYLHEGQGDPIRIELPKGSYAPEFHETGPQQVAVAAAPKRKPWIVVAAACLAAVLGATAMWVLRKPLERVESAPVRRMAVLPFADLSEAKDLQYFCDGVAEDIIDNLSRVPGLLVLARGSAFQFRGAEADARDVGQKLQVDRVLMGSVRKSGSKLRVSAQLVDTANGVALWSSSFDRDTKDKLEVQDEIAREVTRSLQVQMAAKGGAAKAPADPAAYDLYLKGRYYYWRSTPEDEDRALGFFEEAVAKDPSLAPAWAGLADVLASGPTRGVKVDPTTVERARNAAKRALDLDPQLVDGLLAQAHLARTLDYDWKEAERLYRQAVALQPGGARVHNSYGVLLSLAGRLPEADKEYREALRLDPLSLQVMTNLTLNLYRQERYEEAVELARKGASIDPNFRNIYSPMAASLGGLGRTAEALATLDTLREKGSGTLQDHHLALRGYILARSGDRAQAQAVLNELEARAKSRYVPRAAFADVLLGMGENDRAFERMEEALAAREVLLAGLLVSPHTSRLRNDKRYVSLTARLARR